jgi:hypothetical protein
MKVALLLFGQLRWMDNPHTVKSHHDFIIDKYDTDIFGHFWNPENTEKLTQSGHVKWDPSPSDKDATTKIQEQYKFTQIKFSDPIRFEFANTLYQKATSREWPLIWEKGWFEWPNAFNNILSQQYSIQQVSRIFEKYLEENPDKQYDFVIMSRPDICIWEYPDLNNIQKGGFYISNHHYKFPDLACILDVKYLKAFSNLYDNTVNITDDELYSLWEPNAEALKYNSFRKHYNIGNITSIPLPVRIVRGNDCRGPQW